MGKVIRGFFPDPPPEDESTESVPKESAPLIEPDDIVTEEIEEDDWND